MKNIIVLMLVIDDFPQRRSKTGYEDGEVLVVLDTSHIDLRLLSGTDTQDIQRFFR